MENDEIKALYPTECPHCKKSIIVEFKNKMPQVTEILTPADIEDAKQRALREVSVVPISDEKRKSVIEWIKDEETIFTPSDVDQIINNLLDENKDATLKEDTA